MSDLTYQENAAVTAYKCVVFAGDDAASAIQVGFVDSVTISKNIQTQRAQVVGSIMPVSIDPQSLSASVSMSGFIATKEVVSSSKYGKADATINAFCPDDSVYTSESLTKIPYLAFKKRADGGGFKSICHVEWCIPTSYQVQAQGQSYVKANIQMEAITMNIDSDYQDNSFGYQTTTSSNAND